MHVGQSSLHEVITSHVTGLKLTELTSRVTYSYIT